MIVQFNPMSPPDSESRSRGAQRIRALTQSLLRLFGFTGDSITTTEHPFDLDASTGLVAVRGDPLVPLGVATKQFVEQQAQNAASAAVSQAATYTDTQVNAATNDVLSQIASTRYRALVPSITTDGTEQTLAVLNHLLPPAMSGQNIVIIAGAVTALSAPGVHDVDRFELLLEHNVGVAGGGTVQLPLLLGSPPSARPSRPGWVMAHPFCVLPGCATDNVSASLKVTADPNLTVQVEYLCTTILRSGFVLV